MKLSSKQKGIILLVCSAFFFTVMNFLAKQAGDLPSIQKAFFRNIVAAFSAGIVLAKSQTGFKFQKSNLLLLILRSTFGTLGIICNFYAVQHLFLAEATILNKLAPFFVIIFSFMFLKEKIKPYQIIAVIIAFLATLLIIKPSFSGGSHITASLIGTLGGMVAGAAYTSVRALSLRGENKAFIVFFFSLFSAIVMLPFFIIFYQEMTLIQITLLLLVGLSATAAQFCITAAYGYAPARSISLFDYTQILFAAAFGFIAFAEVPDLWSVLGFVIIFCVSLFMFLYQKKDEK
ncbi:MAG: EamA family transporter [Treponema sp.]|nr:MAG: EamA family transporter [Treponema sp.]